MNKVKSYSSPACSWVELEEIDSGSAALHADFRADLIRRFGRPGPRYTSYPTAPHFREDIDPEALLADLGDPAHASRPLSLYVHLPFCETQCWFCGCTRVITRDRTSADRYLDTLEKEIGLVRERMEPSRSVVQIHLGGGTPTFLSVAQLRRLGALLRTAFRVAEDCECSVEIDPRRLEREQVEVLRESGFNRASLGVQDHNPEVQRQVNRIQPEEVTDQAIDWLREAGFESINVDLIYGLPAQTVESFSATAQALLERSPDRIALFGYAHVPWVSPAQKIFDRRGNLPDESARLALLERSCGLLTGAGYVYIGMDHFALPGDPLAEAKRRGTLQRNFQGYSTRAGVDICGFGMSAISQTANAYRQNEKDLDSYTRAVESGRLPVVRGLVLTRDDQIRREVIMRLMCELDLDFKALSERFGFAFSEVFAKELNSLKPLAEAGLVELDDRRLHVTPVGQYLLRNIAMSFDAYLQQGKGRYSKTI